MAAAERINNHSMLPPGKLPAWLLGEKTPVNIYNYSMRPSNTPAQMPFGPVREETPAKPGFAINPSPEQPAVEPAALEGEQPAWVKKLVADAIASIPKSAPQVSNDIPLSPEINAGDEPTKAEAVDPSPEVAEDALMKVEPEKEEAIAPVHVPETETYSPEPLTLTAPLEAPAPEPPILASAEPPLAAQAPPQREYAPNTGPQPSAPTFADWVLNHSRAALIILVAIILLPILLLVLGII